jgi:hypothetical protein
MAYREQDQGKNMQEILNTLSRKDAALLYAQTGWPVFPLAGKVPYEGMHGHRDATTDREQIAAWWSDHPKANIGLATGSTSGVIVLDMDVPKGYFGLKDLQEQYGALPPTRTVHTASRGLHYYFQYPKDGNTYPNTVGLADRIGVDVRAEGGYVVLPPSKLFGRREYTWATYDAPIAPLPDWLHALLPKKGEHQQFPHGLRFASPSGEKWLTEAVDRATEGNRNAVGFWLTCQLRDDGISQEQAQAFILSFANRIPQETSPYTSQEAVKSVRSAYGRLPRPPAERQTP